MIDCMLCRKTGFFPNRPEPCPVCERGEARRRAVRSLLTTMLKDRRRSVWTVERRLRP